MKRVFGGGLVALALVGAGLSLSSPARGVAGFGDVADGRYFTEPVQWMVDNEITTGTSETCFSPHDTVTRGQAAALMWRMEGRPSAPPHPFNDVVASWQQGPVSWMFDQGITTGTTNETYSPERPLTRGQAATLLWRLANEPSAPPHPFNDVVASWQQGPVSWMATTDPVITTGTTPTTFSPDDPVTRGQLATFFWRYKGEPPVTLDMDHPTSPICEQQVEGPPSLGLATSELWIEQTVTFNATGLAPGSTAVATLFSDPVEIGTATVDENGVAEFTVQIPEIEEGDHTLVISGTDPQGNQATISQPVVVRNDGNPPVVTLSSVSSSVAPGGTIRVVGSATDESGIEEIWFNTTPQMNCEGPPAYNAYEFDDPTSVSFDLTCVVPSGQASGSYSLNINSRDVLANYSQTTQTLIVTED